MTHEHEITARAALADLHAYHERELGRITAAIEALNGGPVVPLVRPEPTPDVIDAPVVLPKLPVREQRPAATNKRSMGMQAVAAQRVTCDDCGHEFSKLGIGSHRLHAHPLPAAVPVAKTITEQVLAKAVAEIAPTAAYLCVTCTEQFAEKVLLARHTIAEHRRGPLSSENQPVAA